MNKTVRVIWADFFWNRALIDRVELAVIDGGHGLVPLPDFGRTVSHYEVAAAELVHTLDGRPDHDSPTRYVDTLSFHLVDDIERRGAGTPAR